MIEEKLSNVSLQYCLSFVVCGRTDTLSAKYYLFFFFLAVVVETSAITTRTSSVPAI